MEKRGGICEAQPAVALSWLGGGIAWLAIRVAMPSGAVVVAGGLKRLGDDGQVGEECCLTSLKCLDLGRLPWS